MTYIDALNRIENLSFDSIIELNKSLVPSQYRSHPWQYPGLNHGTAVLTTEEQCSAYIAAYGDMHQSKIFEVLNKIKIDDFKNTDIQIIDWGCGQGLATVCLFDYLQKNGINIDFVQKVVLVEPSTTALKRADNHIKAYLQKENKTVFVEKYLDDVTEEDIQSNHPVTIHLFSNILDIPSIDLLQLANKIKKNLHGLHYFFCWGPLNYGNSRIDSFWNYFNEADFVFFNAHSKQEYDDEGKIKESYNYTAKNRVFKVNGDECDLIFVDYYQPKQFHAAYQLDVVRNALQNVNIDKDKLKGLYKNLSDFELQTPFDIGASIYEDVHPILAVLNNIVTRGLPTKASPFIEDAFKSLGNEQKKDSLGNICYHIDHLDNDELFLAMHLVDSRWTITRDNYNTDVLDSDLEITYITEKTTPILRQLLQPQRSLASISSKTLSHSQRVDFAFEFPYATKNGKGADYQGCVVELDGNRYHSDVTQLMYDQRRNQVLREANWYCLRLNEGEIEKSYDDYHHLGSDYVKYCEQTFCKKFDNEWVNTLQLVLSPIAVARLEKTILEALMTGQLDLAVNKWKVLVKEHDVPCAALAFEELRQMFEHVTQLSSEYSNLHFPDVDLTIVSSKEFANSPLHLSYKPLVDEYHSNAEYDMVIDFAILRRSGLEKIDFSDYKCKNKCYFNVRSAHYHRNERQIYTSNRILYKQISLPNDQGRYDNIEKNVMHLRYFLRMLFRKMDFRPGQIPILNRALQYKSVIGLLPTGGGKSLTYQIAAMLQPGITLVIDPLRSLMQDQFDGLVKTGIDCCSYINSSIEVPESIKNEGDYAIKKYRIEERERRSRLLEKSEFLFMFLSPERLSIFDFRERLKNMQETGVYFAYGVIDEVHCVSEWGHDFRTSYLHLGRNLYKYVLPKPQADNDNESHIPLLGLTATASFDVLADVERELSGNGAFPLDADTIVREGDTNRIEIQYKIVPVPVVFTQKENNGSIKQSNCKWMVYDAKMAQLDNLISQMPSYLEELQTDDSIMRIIAGYIAGPRAKIMYKTDSPLLTKIPSNFFILEDKYYYGGIVFCPHVDNTGVAVFPNQKMINKGHPDTLIGTFVGSSKNNDRNGNYIDKRVEKSFVNLDLFRDNKIPLMIATKAFGMGIDKQNVRFTINMNFSSSLESYVQEAGRAGRDQRIALSIIMLSKYRIARVKPDSIHYQAYKDRWYDISDIEELSRKKGIPIEDFEICDETSDLVKLNCKQCGNSCERFERNCCSWGCTKDLCSNRKASCNQACRYIGECKFSKIPSEDRWSRHEHLKKLKEKYPFITNENYEYLNADYETVMYFYNSNFKGEHVEYLCICQLLSGKEMEISVGDVKKDAETLTGFLSTLQSANVGEKVICNISYLNNNEYEDIAKAIYRMCCINLIDDFTQDYNSNQFRIVSQKKAEGEYYNALEQYLRRYYSVERAKELIKEVPLYEGENEIHKCLGYLTHFIYDKIAVKRKRAIDDMFAFCLRGSDDSKDWKVINEELKDDLYFYFNSKYARKDYKTENGEDYSLLNETKEGKQSSKETLFKFMKVVNPQWIIDNSEAGSTQIDNAKHLYGAVRLIRRSATDQNPTIDLLGAFCLMFLGTNNNPVLQEELDSLYRSGMREFHKRANRNEFWDIFNEFNDNPNVKAYFANNGGKLKSLTILDIHNDEISILKKQYTE